MSPSKKSKEIPKEVRVRAARPKLIMMHARVPETLLNALDAHVAKLQEKNPMLTRSDLIRELIQDKVSSLANERSKEGA